MNTHPLNVQKLGKPIAIGRTAEIYDWEPGWVLKLYFEQFGKPIAEFERYIAAAICADISNCAPMGGMSTAAGCLWLPRHA